MVCVVVLLRLQLNFWISFEGKSVVDLIIYCGAVVAGGSRGVLSDTTTSTLSTYSYNKC